MDITNRQQSIINFLCNQASKSTMQSKHAAALVKGGGKIICSGINSRREFIGGNKVSSTHAEISVIYRSLNARVKKSCRQDRQKLFL
jgi:hypothetical protein